MKCCSFLINLLTTKAHIDYDLNVIKYINNCITLQNYSFIHLQIQKQCNLLLYVQSTTQTKKILIEN